MTRLFCVNDGPDGIPCACRLMGKKMCNWNAITDETARLKRKGWKHVYSLCDDLPLQIQAAKWAQSLLSVNPRYVLNPAALVAYVRGKNWNDPGAEYAHYEDYVKAIGPELWHEFASLRSVPCDVAADRVEWLLRQIGLEPRENL